MVERDRSARIKRQSFGGSFEQGFSGIEEMLNFAPEDFAEVGAHQFNVVSETPESNRLIG